MRLRHASRRRSDRRLGGQRRAGDLERAAKVDSTPLKHGGTEEAEGKLPRIFADERRSRDKNRGCKLKSFRHTTKRRSIPLSPFLRVSKVFISIPAILAILAFMAIFN